jgi:hypothetical protein
VSTATVATRTTSVSTRDVKVLPAIFCIVWQLQFCALPTAGYVTLALLHVTKQLFRATAGRAAARTAMTMIVAKLSSVLSQEGICRGMSPWYRGIYASVLQPGNAPPIVLGTINAPLLTVAPA